MLKWIYRLGVEHERNRIKRLVAEFSNEVRNKEDELNMFHAEFDKPTKEQKIKDYQIHSKAMSIINKLFEPKFIGERTYGAAPIDED